MDGTRFDGVTRFLSSGTSRRQALRGLASGTVAGLLRHAGSEEASAVCIRPGRKGCQGPQHRRCCAGARCKRGSNTKEGRCACKRSLKKCGKTCVDLKKDKLNCGACTKRCTGTGTCKNGTCVSVLGCRAGNQTACDDPAALCPVSNDPTCHCITDIEGNPRCSDLDNGGFCSDCTRSAECPSGLVCVANSGVNCFCSNSACVRPTCGGVS